MMHIDKISMIQEADKNGFVLGTFEKVYRLIDVLSYCNQDEVLHDALALKGGTAINLTIFDLPRLSVDIDMDFTLNITREKMTEQRKIISDRLRKYMDANRYNLRSTSKYYHALDSFVFSYENINGINDNLKIEINYMMRNHIFEPAISMVHLPWANEDYSVMRLNPIEIFSSKIVALLNRSMPRDIYDVYHFIKSELSKTMNKDLLRKSVLFYLALGSEHIPEYISFDRIKSIPQFRIKTDLVPVIRKGEYFDVHNAVNTCVPYLKSLLTITEKEKYFLDEFRENRYKPELLFEDQVILSRIERHPMAMWKCRETIADPHYGFKYMKSTESKDYRE